MGRVVFRFQDRQCIIVSDLEFDEDEKSNETTNIKVFDRSDYVLIKYLNQNKDGSNQPFRVKREQLIEDEDYILQQLWKHD